MERYCRNSTLGYRRFTRVRPAPKALHCKLGARDVRFRGTAKTLARLFLPLKRLSTKRCQSVQ